MAFEASIGPAEVIVWHVAVTLISNGSSQRDIHFQVDVLRNMSSKPMPKEKLSGAEMVPFQSEVSCYDHL